MILVRPAFSATLFADPQLQERLRLLTADLDSRPGCPLPQACRSKAALKAAYRFFDHPGTAAERLLPAFVRPAVAALARRRFVLVGHDSTSFNFSGLKAATGLGFINDSPSAKGIHLHSSLLLDPDANLVGIGQLHFWVREHFRTQTAQQIRDLPIDDKESRKWLLGMRAVHDAFNAASPRPPRLIHVMDREGDIHEVFAEVKRLKADAVIRCAQDRRVEGDQPEKVEFAKQRVGRQKTLGRMQLRVPLAEGGYRSATVEVRTLEVRLRPNESKRKGRKPLRLGLVEVREVSQPPEGQKAAAWWLWTTLRVRRLKQVQRVVMIYRARWRLEDYHRALKSGCKVEKMRLQEAEALMKALTIQAQVATRVVRLRDLAKNDPQQDCEACFSVEQWQLLWAHHHQKAWRPVDGKPTLGEVVRWLGRLGGHLGRNNDPPPGAECLSKALYALDLLVQGRRIGRAEVAAGGRDDSAKKAGP